jgi:hypothetical protein
MKYSTIEDKIEHCKTSILVCKEKIKVEGPNGDGFWVNFKKQWEKELEKLESELNNSKQ